MKALVRILFITCIAAFLPVLAAQSPVIWTGGITLDERETAPDRGTRLEFCVSSGKFLSDINVVVKDSNNREIVNSVSRGPWLILDLAPGAYHVQAARGNGDTQGGIINVGENTEKFTFMFPDE